RPHRRRMPNIPNIPNRQCFACAGQAKNRIGSSCAVFKSQGNRSRLPNAQKFCCGAERSRVHRAAVTTNGSDWGAEQRRYPRSANLKARGQLKLLVREVIQTESIAASSSVAVENRRSGEERQRRITDTSGSLSCNASNWVERSEPPGGRPVSAVYQTA